MYVLGKEGKKRKSRKMGWEKNTANGGVKM